MEHPYKSFPRTSFWRRAVTSDFSVDDLAPTQPILRAGDRIVSAGSCFAANIVPYIESAGFSYVRTEEAPAIFGDLRNDRFSYSKFSAAYGNIYTARQAVQLLQRALGRFTPKEDRWVLSDDVVIDAFRPGLRWPATSEAEFDNLCRSHLERVLAAIEAADCFVFTLGLTEAWMSREDGAVFPACPGTIAGSFDPARHAFKNFTAAEVTQDLHDLITLAREIRPGLRFVLTVSPVPLVATATTDHVLVATTYSKAVLRVAASETAAQIPDVWYFPAYEIVTGPQAPPGSYQDDLREPSVDAIGRVMQCFLRACETNTQQAPGSEPVLAGPSNPTEPRYSGQAATVGGQAALQALAKAASEAFCEEAAAGL